MVEEISVPDIGDYQGVDVIEVSVSPGEKIEVDQTLITLETDKASMDIPSPKSGIIKKLCLKVGDKVSQGDCIIELDVQVEDKHSDSQNAPKGEAQNAPLNHTPVAQNAHPASFEKCIEVPDIGSSDKVDVIEVHIQAGQSIEKEAPMLTLESEKASMDVPAPEHGDIKEVLVKVGDKVGSGDPIAKVLVTSSEPNPKTSVSSDASQNTRSQPSTSTENVARARPAEVSHSNSGAVHAGPATRRLARELGVDLEKVQGSGRKGRVLKNDVKMFVKTQLSNTQSSGSPGGLTLASMPKVDFSQFGDIESKPLNRIKKLTATNLHRNWVQIPHVTQFDQADITDLEVFRKQNKGFAEKQGIRLTPLAFFVKAIVSSLKAFPEFNTSLDPDNETLIYKQYFHIGVAVDTPNGLVVPVIREVDRKGVFALARELAELSEQAREGKLTAKQMQGSCFTISSLGGLGGVGFTPIINAPDVAILGVSKASLQPVYQEDSFVPRLILPFSLSYDHRVIDGAQAVRFTTHFSEQLRDIRNLIM